MLVDGEYGPFVASNVRMMPKLTPITIRSIFARANAGQVLWSIFTLNEYDPSTVGIAGAIRKQLEKKISKLPDSKLGGEIYDAALSGLKLSELSEEVSTVARKLGQEPDKSSFRQRYIPTSVALNSRRVASRRLAVK